ncbi:hypothetical protein AN2373.2 [Aspergillus nidulans FGSC A4]|uniref:EKC/KEOPS complex subunit BUD32 n=1 Tax=Emericella nidulans (strain FGSC A4 / ATCC 38163 / CBS 112.46 / NRRL 194 / M139) TaxID=227321 RepID=Q5BAQ7_EMENI|nr:protein ffkC [Aspergillus nidulans FGSC A4]EAA64484.1 hypothetical protein AN2373.2 [Aspergillus nidulans FGSC A4]CBF86715.1 TPA: conserved hypothetical protein [Aspergillus nidulans FGSC A4]|eukprot:XP_659977.1 hypothetical protein AN2373.2 [Aspergillus nidulans FGSC A4]
MIAWNGWHEFANLFLRGRDCGTRNTDEAVRKLSSPDLEQCLGVSYALNFQNWIAAFNPIVIQFGKIMACKRDIMLSSSGHSEYVQVSDGARLPFLLNESVSVLGRGGCSTVTREIIAEGQFQKSGECNIKVSRARKLPVRQRLTRSPPQPKVIARKRFNDKIYFDRERVIMSLLEKGLQQHNHIVYPLAMISLESEYSILMDVADCNLETFLTEEGRVDSNISLKSLLKQVANIAHALYSLHTPGASGYVIHHLDLTPKNVLVKLINHSDNPWTWMLSDFGWSRHYDGCSNAAAARSGANAVQATDQVEYSERTGTYLPKEKERSSYTDIWSLGCIMCRVVCRKRHGIEGLRQFDELRLKDDPDRNDYFYRGTTVNPYVTRLLDQFCDSGCNMTTRCGNLLKSMLSMDKSARPTAWDLHNDLKQITDTCEEFTHTVIPLELESQRPQKDSVSDAKSANTVDRSPNPVFLAIENQREDDALVQIKSFLRGSIRAYSSIEQYDERLTPLCHAAEKGYTKVVKFLHQKGAQIDERDTRSNTPLMYACKRGHCGTAEYLIDQGADWNLQGEDGYTCLHFATECKNTEIIDVFIQKQPASRVKLNANILNTLDRTPLELTLYMKSGQARYKLMEQLISLRAKACATSRKQNHKTAVDFALERRDQQAMKILVTDVDKTWKIPKSNMGGFGPMKDILRRAGRLEGLSTPGQRTDHLTTELCGERSCLASFFSLLQLIDLNLPKSDIRSGSIVLIPRSENVDYGSGIGGDTALGRFGNCVKTSSQTLRIVCQ